MIPIETKRLILRRMASDDLRDFLAYQTHPDNLRYMPGDPFSDEKAAAFLERQSTLEIGDAGGWLAFAVELRGERRMIGEVGAYIQPRPKNEGDLGWSFHPDYHGHGYATEAARVLLQYLFVERELHRLTAGCDAANLSSVRLMERLGMRREAHFHESRFARAAWQDEYVYALLHSEWTQRQAR